MSEPVQVLTPEYYERLAALETRHWWWRGLRGIAQSLLDGRAAPPRNGRVLDAGCGTGLTLSWVGRYTSAPPTGLDRAREGLAFCRTRGHRRLIQGDVVTLPFASASFDLVLSLDVIQHLPRPGGDISAAKEINRVLAPGGHLLLRTNSRCGYPPDAAIDYHRYALDEVRALLVETGFTCITLSYVNVIPALLLTLRRTMRGAGAPSADPGLPPAPPEVDRSLRARVGLALLGAEAAYLRHVASPLPYGHSIVALAHKHHS